jgi:SAM-dependent methyltransferase
MTTGCVQVSPAWLALRESADAAARASRLVGAIRRCVGSDGNGTVIHDLGCGTGSMARWLAPLLTGGQHWVLYDHDAGLLEAATAGMPVESADGAAISVEGRHRDVTRLGRRELAGASMITASALLDILTVEELDRLVTSCLAARCPALITLTVTGRIRLTPADPLDRVIAAAFNANQRRTSGGRRLLGPDAAVAAAARFTREGADVIVRPSPWRLGPDDAVLATEWFGGWYDAAMRERPDLRVATFAYAARRRADAVIGRLRVTVHHTDVLVRPR